MNLPDNLPPLPPVPPGFDRWEYRGTNYSTKTGALTDHCVGGESYWLRHQMKFDLDWPIEGSPHCHVIEAVRDKPAETLLDQGLQDNRPPA
jgi:hypothetical protein